MIPSTLRSCILSTLVILTFTARSEERPLRELYSSYFPFNTEVPVTPDSWPARQKAVRDRVLLASGLYPLPTKTPLNTVIHGRIERDDYTIDRVYFESFPGHYVCGNLYLPKNVAKDSKIPGVLCPHGHWPNGRFMDLGPGTPATKEQLAIGAERWESGARSPLQARCVQLARMGCAVFFYDMLGNADSIQIPDHRSGRRADLSSAEPGTYGLFSPMADLRLQSNFGLQTWNSVRALDFMLSLPNVDATRVSCTGASGGGTQTMILAAIDDRLATSFPCVMVSTAMQGGCPCENANYLRINQGNIDIAAASAPKPMGMTAADDWTKELELKGFPDLKSVWTKLGKPNNVMATYNIHWKHNYNHVSRTTMYGFMNKHFKLGLSEPILERDFIVSTPQELSVWTKEHPKPIGEKVGATHEKALLKHWSNDSDKLLSDNQAMIANAWKIIVGRELPSKEDIEFQADKIKNRKHSETTPITLFTPTVPSNNTTIVWLRSDNVQKADPQIQKLLDTGYTLVVPQLYLPGATHNPMNPVKAKDQTNKDGWQWSACFTYGYNPPLLIRRVHDAMNAVIYAKQKATRVILVANDNMGVVGALTTLMTKANLDQALIDTGGFRFATLNDPMNTQFVPGAVKYGDLPVLLKLCELPDIKLKLFGEGGIEGGTPAIVEALLKSLK